MQIIDCDQNSPEWFAARMGIPTASMFDLVTAKKGPRGGEPASYKGRRTYMLKLAAEIITGEVADGGMSRHMHRGHEMESEVRDLYAFMNDVDPQLVGFITNGKAGASPDCLIGSDGLLEVKTKLAHFVLEIIMKDEFPAEHFAQCQGQLWVAERDWCDIAVYWPGVPLFVKRAYRDEEYIKALSEAVDQFNEELAAIIAKFQPTDKTRPVLVYPPAPQVGPVPEPDIPECLKRKAG